MPNLHYLKTRLVFTPKSKLRLKHKKIKYAFWFRFKPRFPSANSLDIFTRRQSHQRLMTLQGNRHGSFNMSIRQINPSKSRCYLARLSTDWWKDSDISCSHEGTKNCHFDNFFTNTMALYFDITHEFYIACKSFQDFFWP